MFLAELQPQISWCRFDYEIVWKSGLNRPINKLSSIIEQRKIDPDSTTCQLTEVPGPPPMCLVSVDVKSLAQSKTNHFEVLKQF